MNTVRCTKCQAPLPPDLVARQGIMSCPRCNASLELFAFPAIQRQIGPGSVGETSMVDGETTCFFHAEKKASVVCNGCGRFLCALCDVAIGNDHLCPKCVETGRTKNTLTTFESYRTSYPSLVLTLAFAPLLVFPFTLATAPVAVIMFFVGWNKPPSVTGNRRRGALLTGFIFALLQCVGWAIFLFYIYGNMTHG